MLLETLHATKSEGIYQLPAVGKDRDILPPIFPVVNYIILHDPGYCIHIQFFDYNSCGCLAFCSNRFKVNTMLSLLASLFLNSLRHLNFVIKLSERLLCAISLIS